MNLFDEYEDIRGELRLALELLEQKPVGPSDLQRAANSFSRAWRAFNVLFAARSPVAPSVPPSRVTAVVSTTLVRAPAHDERPDGDEGPPLGLEGGSGRRSV